jgi:glycosyltransferase EpsF
MEIAIGVDSIILNAKGVRMTKEELTQSQVPIRVLHILGGAQRGGTESVVFNYYRAINRDKVQFDIAIDDCSPCDIPESIQALGCRVYKIPHYTKLIRYCGAIRKLCSMNNYKIIHSHINAMSVFPLFAAWTVGVPIRIAHSHSTSGWGKGEFIRNILKSILCPFSKLFANKYCACSEYAARWLFGNKAFDKGKVLLIQNAIDTKRFAFNPESRDKIRKKLEIEDKFVVGHVGRFSPQKNHSFLIDIFYDVQKEKTDSVLLLIGGTGSAGKGIEGQIRSKIHKLGITDKVIFVGAIEDISPYYQAMDVLILPSLYEGLGMVAIEAQCSGLACVLSDKVPQEVNIVDNIIFLPLDIQNKEWVEAICDVSNKRISNCTEVRYAGFEIAQEADKLEKMYCKFNQTILLENHYRADIFRERTNSEQIRY